MSRELRITDLDRVAEGTQSVTDTALSLVAAETTSSLNSKLLRLGDLGWPKFKLFDNPYPKFTPKQGFLVAIEAGHDEIAAMVVVRERNRFACFEGI